MKNIQLLKKGKSLDEFISIQTHPIISDEQKKQIVGGTGSNSVYVASCDAVCLPSEMCGPYTSCSLA
ncbi:MAG: hypothetical protein LBC68_04525 [Prevotellaceae bacterium]|jgi:hypothetical protein|nr:hypothetical protein [Prevotellaceae bacterium]